MSATLLQGNLQFPSDGHDTGGLVATPVSVNGTYYFQASDVAGRPAKADDMQLWKSDGTPAGTTKVVNPPASSHFTPSDLTAYNGKLFFSAYDNTQLWVTDGTSQGTQLVKTIKSTISGSYPTTNAASPISDLTVSNGKLYFAGNDGVHGSQVWVSDGTAAGTHALAAPSSGAAPASPRNLTDVSGTLFFVARSKSGDQLWEVKGAGLPVLLHDHTQNFRAIGNLLNANGKLFFTANDPVEGELWTSDGTQAGTTPVPVSGPHPTFTFNSTGTDQWTAVGGRVFFNADDGSDGRELWVSDGTTGGTHMVADIYPGNAGPAHPGVANSGLANPGRMVALNGNVFFAANNGVQGQELWTSDGNVLTLVADINPGPTGANPQNLTAANGMLYFLANDGTHGVELWQSDGTTAGTQMVQDLDPGAPSGLLLPNARPGTLSAGPNNTLFFMGTDGSNGTGLWTLAAGVALDQPPTASAGGPYSITAGSGLTLNGTGSDTDGDILTYSWDINGDGIYGDATGATPTLTAAQLQALGIQAGPAPYSVSVQVDDGHGHIVTSAATTLTVLAPPLTINPVAVRVAEGSPFNGTVATFTDTSGTANGVYTATINWGDGTAPTVGTVTAAGGQFVVAGGHTFVRSGTFAVTISVQPQGQAAITATGTAVVADLPLKSVGRTVQAMQNRTFTGPVAVLTDTNRLATDGSAYTITINWGDGTTSAGNAVYNPQTGTFAVYGSHAYSVTGTLPVSVFVKDGTSTTSASSHAVVSQGVVKGTSSTFKMTLGQPTQGLTAVFVNSSPGGGNAQYSATINWGDGQTSVGIVKPIAHMLPGNFQVLGTHTYTTVRSFPVVVFLVDNQGDSLTIHSTAHIRLPGHL